MAKHIKFVKHICDEKKSFNTLICAQKSLNAIHTEGIQRDKMPIRIYHCDRCHKYHFTSKPKFEAKSVNFKLNYANDWQKLLNA